MPVTHPASAASQPISKEIVVSLTRKRMSAHCKDAEESHFRCEATVELPLSFCEGSQAIDNSGVSLVVPWSTVGGRGGGQ